MVNYGQIMVRLWSDYGQTVLHALVEVRIKPIFFDILYTP